MVSKSTHEVSIVIWLPDLNIGRSGLSLDYSHHDD